MKRVMLGVFILLATAAIPAGATEYLNNGGFETGDFTGWTGNPDFTTVQSGLSPNGEFSGPQSGQYYLYGGPLGADGTLSQTFSDSAGEQLTITGWVIATGLDDPSHVNFLFNGNLIGGTADPVPNQPWTQYSFSVTATGNDTFAVAFRDDPAFLGLDSFSVTSTVSAVPEASTWTLMILGFAGLGLTRLRRKKVILA